MKKINSIWAILLFAIVPMLFTSCEQQQNASNAILGTWKLVKYGYRTYFDGVLEADNIIAAPREEQHEFYFSSDGQMTVTNEYYSDYEGYITNTWDYYYEIDGNRIYTDYLDEDERQYFRIKRLTSDEMVLLYEDEGYNNDGEWKDQYLYFFTK